jgi:hypothetical protein
MPEKRLAYRVKFYVVSQKPAPKQRRKYYTMSVDVEKEIGEKAAMALAEELHATHLGYKIKAVSAVFVKYTVMTFQP